MKRYGLKDKAADKKFGFSFAKSVDASIRFRTSVCEQLTVYSTKKVVPNREDLAEILKAGKGKVFLIDELILVVSSDLLLEVLPSLKAHVESQTDTYHFDPVFTTSWLSLVESLYYSQKTHLFNEL